MPKRDGIDVGLIPGDLLDSGYYSEIWFYSILQTLNKRNDIERDGLAVFAIGPKEWKKFMTISHRSIQTMRRWLQTLERMGWATAERMNKETHRVTIYADPVEKGNRHGTGNKEPTQTQSDPA